MDMLKLIAQIVEQLKETNRLLAIIANAAQPISGHRVTKPVVPVVMQSGDSTGANSAL